MTHFIDKISSLTPDAQAIICEQATELPHTGAYNIAMTQGSYLCRRCGLALFRANSQFNSSCGWPAFDGIIANTLKELPDHAARIEIQCNRCDGHLGHVFTGEHFTSTNKRYCVNSLAIDFVPDPLVIDTEEAILAGGCFWGVEHHMAQIPGVLNVEVGYSGGTVENPTYDAVCHGHTGHYEAVRVIFDVAKTNYYAILQRFFEIHDPTQSNGQGVDIGHRYQSAVFYYNQQQRETFEGLIIELRTHGYHATTKIMPVCIFWPAEAYHQHYYTKQNKLAYCHHPVERFK